VIRFEVSNPHAHAAVIGERNDPREAGVANGAHVAAKELNDARLARLDDDERTEDDHRDNDWYDDVAL